MIRKLRILKNLDLFGVPYKTNLLYYMVYHLHILYMLCINGNQEIYYLLNEQGLKFFKLLVK